MFAVRALLLVFALGCCTLAAAQPEDLAAYPKLAAACQQNPEKCEELRAKVQAKCAADPQACEQRKAQRAKRAADIKAKCAADPATCEQNKAAMRERLKHRQAQ